MSKVDVNQFMTEILGMWTETDASARRAAIESHFDEGVTFHDPDGEFVGHDGIEAFSDSLQRRLPGARFKLADAPQMLCTPSAASGISDRPITQTQSAAWTLLLGRPPCDRSLRLRRELTVGWPVTRLSEYASLRRRDPAIPIVALQRVIGSDASPALFPRRGMSAVMPTALQCAESATFIRPYRRRRLAKPTRARFPR